MGHAGAIISGGKGTAAEKVNAALADAGLRATIDLGSERIQAKIKVGTDDRVPYLAIVGGKDEEAGTVSVRKRGVGDTGAEPVDAFVARVREEADSRALFDTAQDA